MGSLEEAAVTGFMCRLCSSINKQVVHVFGMEHLNLLRKIEVTVEVKILPNDNLPKTICPKCITAVEMNYNFIKMVRRNYKISKKRLRDRTGATTAGGGGGRGASGGGGGQDSPPVQAKRQRTE